MKITHLSFALLSSLLLVACGGSSGGGSKNSSSPSSASSSALSSNLSSSTSSSSTLSSSVSSSSSQPSTPVTYSLGGSVSGLDGSLTLKAGDQSVAIAQNGAFSFAAPFTAGTQISLSLNDIPFRQQCAITSETSFALQNNVDNISVTCTPLGVLTGNISSYHTGSPINQAYVTVTAIDSNGETLMNASARTNESGAFRIVGLGIATRFVLNAWGDGFATRSEVFSNSAEQPNVDRSALVLQANYSTAFSASSAANLVVDGQTLVELPANAFVTANGSPATGTITPALTIIDPSGDAGVMPGNYEVRDPATGAISLMESFGAIDASFRDADGNSLQLAPGISATISIPVASRINTATAPTSVPLFYFDETSGYWVQEGEATLVQVEGEYVYRGTVTHFTTWNADRIYETVNLRGCVRDAANNPLGNVRIVASGRDYIGQSTAYSDANGTFVIPVRRESSVLITSISGSQSDTIIASSSAEDSEITNCLQLAESSATITLTWGENPEDLDSHWFVPHPTTTDEYEIYFGNKTQEVNGVVFDLDVDDVTSFGPEVVTVPDFPHAGTYRYVVKLYSGSGTIASSPARVELNLRGNIHVFSPAQASGDQSDRYWHVFNIQVDAEGNTNLATIQEFTDSEEPAAALLRSSRLPSLKAGSSDSLSTTPTSKPKETKHYTY